MTQQEREKRFEENWDILCDIVNGAGDKKAKKYLQSFIESEINLAVKAREEEIVEIINELTPKKDFTSYGINGITMTLDDHKRNHAKEIISLIKPTC